MKKIRKIIIIFSALVLLLPVLSACSNKYIENPATEDDIKFDIIQVMTYVRVADGFFATYGSVIPSVFVDGSWTLSYEKAQIDGEELYIATVSGQYHPDYKDKESTKTGTIKFLMDLDNPTKKYRAKAPWPYEDPDGIDDIIWRFVTHKDFSERKH